MMTEPNERRHMRAGAPGEALGRRNESSAASAHPKRWTQVPADTAVLVERDGRQLELGEEISARQAARLLGINPRTMQRKCDSGVLREGIDWHKIPATGSNGSYRINRAAEGA
jgi:hypothetical protein